MNRIVSGGRALQTQDHKPVFLYVTSIQVTPALSPFRVRDSSSIFMHHWDCHSLWAKPVFNLWFFSWLSMFSQCCILFFQSIDNTNDSSIDSRVFFSKIALGTCELSKSLATLYCPPQLTPSIFSYRLRPLIAFWICCDPIIIEGP